MFTPSFKQIDLTRLAADAVQEMLPQAVASAVVLAAHLVDPGPIIAGEWVALRRAATDVIQSAFEVTPAAGLVEVIVRVDDRHGQLVVRDSGAVPGRRHFASARRIVHAHGGGIDISTAAGQGTTVTLSFPVARADGQSRLRGALAA